MLRRTRLLTVLFLLVAVSSTAQKTKTAKPFHSTIDRLFNKVEGDIMSSAEAMPAERFDFTPDSLRLAGTAFDGVRTFRGQIMHLATDNLLIWSTISGEKLKYDLQDVNGPADIVSKKDVLGYLKYSFDVGRRAINLINADNATQLLHFRYDDLSRIDLAFYGIVHANEHYGQMVVYLRMCGLVPPPTRSGN